MTEEQIRNIAIAELTKPTLGGTEQYLEIHSAVKENGAIKVDRIDLEGKDEIGIVYIPIEGEYFHFAVYVDLKKSEVTGVGTESWNRVYFRATSEEHSFQELQAMTTLEPTDFWNKGDLRSNGKTSYSFSSFKLLPNPEPDEFEDKLRKLLDVIETDSKGIQKLVETADVGIIVAMNFHNGNGMLGGMYIDEESIKRISRLNLSIDFDLYADGNNFKE